MRPAVPLYWRYAPAVFTLFEETRPIYDQHGITLAKLFNDIVAKELQAASGSHYARSRKCCTPLGVASPIHSAGCQPFLRSTEPSKPFR